MCTHYHWKNLTPEKTTDAVIARIGKNIVIENGNKNRALVVANVAANKEGSEARMIEKEAIKEANRAADATRLLKNTGNLVMRARGATNSNRALLTNAVGLAAPLAIRAARAQTQSQRPKYGRWGYKNGNRKIKNTNVQ
tara:strand:+ start:119 stop:535 length:417 start_codon:yes stop_codon:yes gene_type:complete